MRLSASVVPASELKPGDLFSIDHSVEYFENHGREERGAVGEKVYIRTNTPCPEDQTNELVCKVTIHHEH